jgi:hypothetical protein
MRSAWPARPSSDAVWSSSPVRAPVLHPRAQPRELEAVHLLGPRHREQGERQGDLQRSRRRQARARGHVARDLQLRGPHGQLGDHPAHVGPPAAGARRGGEREAVLLAEVERAGDDLVAAERRGGDRHPGGDGEGQAEPVVVVGVLADQVHAAGREGDGALRGR